MDFVKFVQFSEKGDCIRAKSDYEEILNQTQSKHLPESLSTARIQLTRHRKRRTIKLNHTSNETIPFDKIKFHLAATKNDLKTLKSLNFMGNQINTIDQFGWSALMMAACEGSIKSVEFLLDQQADVTIKDSRGRTALQLAESKNFQLIVELIKKKISKSMPSPSPPPPTVEIPPPLPEIGKTTNKFIIKPFYCELCKREFVETNRIQHESSTLHRFNAKDTQPHLSKRYHIPDSNVGFKLMVKQGWDRESGLGPLNRETPSQSYPIKTTLRKDRSGLGVKQDHARITHFSAYDREAVEFRNGRRNGGGTRPKTTTRREIERTARKKRQKEIALRRELS